MSGMASAAPPLKVEQASRDEIGSRRRALTDSTGSMTCTERFSNQTGRKTEKQKHKEVEGQFYLD
jgi:hypothetical protein